MVSVQFKQNITACINMGTEHAVDPLLTLAILEHPTLIIAKHGSGLYTYVRLIKPVTSAMLHCLKQ